MKDYREKQRNHVRQGLEEKIRQVVRELKQQATTEGTKLQELAGDLKLVDAGAIARDILYARQRHLICMINQTSNWHIYYHKIQLRAVLLL